MNSLATIATLYYSPDYSPADIAIWNEEARKRKEDVTKALTKALGCSKMEDQYKVWREHFWSGDYEDYGPELEFPEFVHEYEKVIMKALEKLK